jgi:2-oxoglutarate/2-oxoacid ferredoxin oxidoreductase subunit alpha
MSTLNNVVLTVATPNGSGSQSSNNILLRSLFRMGLPVGGKNLFPSNIQGLPTWFTIRVNEQGFTARKTLADVAVLLNPQTGTQDLKLVRPGGFVFHSTDIKFAPDVTSAAAPAQLRLIPVPFKDIVAPVTDGIKLRKLLINMVYVGILAELLEIPEDVLQDAVHHQFGGKTSVLEPNRKAIEAGRVYARAHLSDINFPFKVRAPENKNLNKDKLLIDGNTASAMGLLYGGCTVVAWYPITPSSSVVESFSELANKYRVDKDGKKNFAIVQAEDELASIAMVVGAGWAGARAMTATSGPGLSLMSEAAGLAYYAEIPSVIWDVQRVGPSTGLPTRTMQGDLLAAYYLSHGDTKHVVLLPGTPAECFEFGQTAFDLAEKLQTLVLVLSDLDLGMNFHVSDRFTYPTRPMDRGKVLNEEQLNKLGGFQRYKDVDGDGIPYRTLTGTRHPQAGYFTRGTGHDEAGLYTESSEVYQANMERLARKFRTAATLVPKPVVESAAAPKFAVQKSTGQGPLRVGLISFGSSIEACLEAQHLLSVSERATETSFMRLRALPFTPEVEQFLQTHDRIYVIEQNRDAQLMSIIRAELPQYWNKCHSVLHFDGMPIDAEHIVTQIQETERSVQ